MRPVLVGQTRAETSQQGLSITLTKLSNDCPGGSTIHKTFEFAFKVLTSGV